MLEERVNVCIVKHIYKYKYIFYSPNQNNIPDPADIYLREVDITDDRYKIEKSAECQLIVLSAVTKQVPR